MLRGGWPALAQALLALVFVMAGPVLAQPDRTVSARFDSYWHALRLIEKNVALGDRERGELVLNLFAKEFGDLDSTSMSPYSSAELKLLMQAAKGTVVQSLSPSVARFAMQVGSELAQRQELGPAVTDNITHMLIATRQLDEARRWTTRFPFGSLRVPDETDKHTPGRPSVWRLLDGHLLREDAAIPAGPFVVIVSHPNCHFSANAADAVNSDTAVAAALKGRSLWLVPQEFNFSMAAFKDWNATHPGQPLALAYLTDEWPVLEHWATPNFYFFKDGKLMRQFSGWPQEGQMDALKAGLRAIGVSP